MTAEWRATKNFPCYEVSSNGAVRRSTVSKYGKRKVPYELSQTCSNGYPAVCLINGTKRSTTRVHRLVAGAFLPNNGLLPQVAHKDGNRMNNNVHNLYWANQSDNEADKFRHDTAPIGELSYNSVLKTSDVLRVREEYKNGCNLSELSRAIGIKYGTLYSAATYKTWKHLPVVICAFMLSACGPQMNGSFCLIYIPVYTTAEDTEETKDQVDRNNAVYMECER